MPSHDFLGIFIVPLEKNRIHYFITGSVASIFYGEPRLTHDIDVVIHLSQQDAISLPSFFPLEQFYCPPEEVIEIERKRKPFGHFNLIHHESGLKADIYTYGEDELHEWAFQNRKRISLTEVGAIWLAPPEYVIIRKLEYFREGGSEKHLVDIRKMLPQVEGELKKDYLNAQLDQRGLKAYWEKVLKCPP